LLGLTSSERDDASDWIVWGDPYGDPIARNDLDAEAAHTTAELGEHLVPRITLNAIQPSAVHCHHCPLHVDQIVFAQTGSKSFPAAEGETLWQ
jgi:hypothetical protein